METIQTFKACSNIHQPGRITSSHTLHLQPAITKVMCHMLWTSV